MPITTTISVIARSERLMIGMTVTMKVTMMIMMTIRMIVIIMVMMMIGNANVGDDDDDLVPSHWQILYLESIFPCISASCYSHISYPKHFHFSGVHKEHLTQISMDSTLKDFGCLRT